MKAHISPVAAARQQGVLGRMRLYSPLQNTTLNYKHLYEIINGRPRECHNKIPQPIPSTMKKRNLHETETTKLHVNNSRKLALSYPSEVVEPLQHTTNN